MSIFIIDENYTMPIHDHPRMCGILKVISGKLKVHCYTRIQTDAEDEIIVRAEEPKILDELSEASIITNDCNFHELTALDGPAAFFDILSPPYSDMHDSTDEARHCSFFKKVMVDNSNKNAIIKLVSIPCPEHYYCDSVIFDQPDFMR